MAKPLPALGLVIGVIASYAAMVAASYATTRLLIRVQVYNSDLGRVLPWLLLIIAVAVVLGVLMMVPVIGSGVTTGAGLLLTVVGVAVLVLPIKEALDLVRLFQFPGSKYGGSYLLFDGSVILFGIPLLLIGIRRWAVDAKLAKLMAGPGQLQDGYQPGYPQQQPQQWGGYPGQQQQPPPPQYPGQQPPQ
ncbi:hypothetical protein OHA18_07870 [Kribbella sp. NBC_00709]|uniref:hypothetical protein n=1 Tax=Kribbella sp. NBC_00709 TaxID=2975972 RepID=UPI002E2A0F7B|nr:hypothetical protein [Kribbella sp. NBC_00709]